MQIIEKGKGVQSKEEAVETIIAHYFKTDVVMGEFLESIELRGFSVIEVVSIYSKAISASDDDILMVRKEGELLKVE